MDELELQTTEPIVEKEPEESLVQTLQDVTTIASLGIVLFGMGAALIRDNLQKKP
jgi:hypothetical protein